MQRHARLTRKSWPKRRAAPLAAESASHRQHRTQQGRAYREAADSEQCWCSACGRAGATDHSHHLTQGGNKRHRNDERNWLKLCRTCHNSYENNRAAFAAAYPDIWRGILASLQALDSAAFAAFRLTYPF